MQEIVLTHIILKKVFTANHIDNSFHGVHGSVSICVCVYSTRVVYKFESNKTIVIYCIANRTDKFRIKSKVFLLQNKGVFTAAIFLERKS